MARKLRIAASVFFGLLTVALCVLWVRSYWHMEQVLCSVAQNYVLVTSVPGAVGITVIPEESIAPWILYNQPASEWRAKEEERWRQQSWGGFYISLSSNVIIVAPYWFWLLIPATLTTILWRFPPRRFSLRTLLIATTLIALVLGLAVWAVR